MPDAPDPHALSYALASLRAEGDDAAADALLAEYGPGAAAPVEKAMSAFADGSGGTLVAPAGAVVPKKRKRKRADVGAAVSRCLKAMYEGP